MEKKYSIRWKKDEATSFTIDGKTFQDLSQVEDPGDLEIVMSMMNEHATTKTVDLAAKPPLPLEKLLFLIFSGIAILMIAAAVVAAVYTSRSLSQEKTAPGLVVALIDRQDTEGDTLYYPSVRFKLPDGRTETVEMNTGTYPPSYETGNQVVVAYPPDNPQNARIKTTGSDIGAYLVTIITAVLGGAFLLASGFTGWMALQGSKKRSQV